MKKIAALLIALLLLLSAPALALSGEGYPAWDGMTVPDDGLAGVIDANYISLNFDPAIEYSNVMDGSVQACFFAYDSTEQTYMELYLLIPQDVAAGGVLRSGDDQNCSVYLYETSIASETFYFAGDAGTGRADDGSGFEISIEAVETTDTAVTMRGKMTAQLCRYDGANPTGEILTIGDAHFSFTLPLGGSTFAPMPTMDPGSIFPERSEAPTPDAPAPAFTLPPNAVSL